MYEFVGSVKSKVILFDDKIIIYPEKTPFERQKEIEIFLSKLVAITVKEPGKILKDGYIQFETPGISFDKSTVSFSGKEKYSEALEFKNKIIEVMKRDSADKTTESYVDELLNCKKLLDAGVLSSEEFEAKKKQLLGL